MFDRLTRLIQKLSPGLRQVIANVSWLLVDKIFQLGLGLVVGIWVARYLQPQSYGLLTYAFTFVSLFRAIAELGLGTLVIRDIARDPSCKEETLGTAFVIRLIGGIATLLLTVGIISLLKPNDYLTRWLVGIVATSTILQAFKTIDYWFQSQLKSKYIVVANNFVSAVYAVLRIVLIRLQMTVIAFAWASLAESALRGLAMVIAYYINGNHLKRWRWSFQRAKILLQESWPLVFSGLAVYVYSKIDQVMLGSLLPDTTQLGYYSVAVKLSEIFDFIPVIIYQSVFPKFSALKQKNPDEYIEKMQIYFDSMALLWILIALPVSLLSPYLIGLLYGQSYASSASILSLYIWAQFGSNFGLARSVYLAVESILQYSLYLSGVGALINIVINWILIPRFGAIGATMATLITYFIVIVIMNFYFSELRLVGKMIFRSFNFYKGASRLMELIR
ncbi:MAG: flippase [Coleofasciculus sp. C1-SOL-03]|jgi:PST family polysaccharide transporter|uniref:flippase n=1 Tax=Coleofasciculus sp. C1-SOL-03 TaxID=3069522 RepID=UPI003302B30F